MSAKMALRRFALEAAGGFRGRDGADAFARGLVGAFSPEVDGASHADAEADADAEGAAVSEQANVEFGYTFPIVADGKKAKRTVSAYWPGRRVLVDVVDRDLMLDQAWGELLRACLQMDAEPQYVVLTNQRDVRLYDLARDRTAPRLTIALDELPKYSEAFPFFAPDWVPGTTPKIINVDKVSKEVADLVAKVYRALAAKNPEHQEDVIRFALQCIVAMFAEDVGLLPKEYFTALLYQAAEDGDAEEKITQLFRWMSTPVAEREDAAQSGAIPYFNGGLFSDTMSIGLDDVALRALTKAAEANWVYVDPHIFGSVFQGVMDDAERHASGAHYTAREDIMSVVGPTIVEPWRERIEAAKKLEDLKEILRDLGTYRVLDPACGSGNFLYVAFRELYRLETEVLVRIYDEFPSAAKGKKRVRWDSGIRTTNFFGIDINPFAVELAKTTLNIAKKIAFEQRKEEVVAKFGQFAMEVDPSLPLDNLDENIVCEDALFSDWPAADAIIGNPPFLGAKKIREELGADYLGSLQSRFDAVNGVVDIVGYWFRIAHDRLETGGRAGLIGTSGIRVGKLREAGLEYLLRTGGVITNAVSSRPWPGDATLNVSTVNWVRGSTSERPVLQVDGRKHRVAQILGHLQLQADLSAAQPLSRERDKTSVGVQFASPHYVVPAPQDSANVGRAGLRPLQTASHMLGSREGVRPKYCWWFAGRETEGAVRSESPLGHAHLEEHVLSYIKAGAASSKPLFRDWLTRWWEPQKPRNTFMTSWRQRSRSIATSRVQSRPIFAFVSNRFIPNDSLNLFAYDDDYSFGIIQSSLHWAWTKAKGGRLKTDIRYTSKVWKTFPWPQAPALDDVIDVAQAAQQLRATRDELMAKNDWSLRDLYRSAEVDGPHPLKDAQARLDAAVEAAYGKPADQEATEFLLEMNLALAEDEADGETIQGPGLPLVDGEALDPKDPRWFSTDCIEPPPLPGLTADDADDPTEDQA